MYKKLNLSIREAKKKRKHYLEVIKPYKVNPSADITEIKPKI